MSQLTVKVRASSWGRLFDCAYAWEGVHLLGMRKPSGMPALLGTSLHASTAAFDTARSTGAPISTDDAAGVLVDSLHSPKGDVDMSASDMTLRDAERIGLGLHTRYCNEVSPRFQFAAVELETKPLDIDCGNGVTITLTGTLDRSRLVAGSNGGARIVDLKSGGRAVEKGVASTKGHAPQVGTYEILYEHSTGQAITAPAEIIGLKTTGKPEIATGEIANAKARMVGTAEAPGLIELASEMFRAGRFPPNPSSQLCSAKFCARWSRCSYHA